MMEIGRLCTKIAGRDAGKKCVIVEVLDDKFVLVDGETRRRKCNMKHLEPSEDMLKISKGAAHTTIVSEFKKLGMALEETKPRQAKPKQKQIRSADRKKMAPKAELKKKAVPKKPEAKPAEKLAAGAKTKLEEAASEEK